jgi:hypothetical protein
VEIEAAMTDEIRLDVLRQVSADCAEITQRAIDEQVHLVQEHLNDAEKAIIAKGHGAVAPTTFCARMVLRSPPTSGRFTSPTPAASTSGCSMSMAPS